MTKEATELKKGGSFLIEECAPEDVFTPEDFSEEQMMIRDMTGQFVEEEVLPQQEKIEHKEWTVTVNLLKRCGELGLLGIEVPEKYGGENLDKVSAMIVAEKLGRVASFAVSYGGHSGIGTLPIVYFGKEEHKRKYLPLLCKAEKISAYALSEAGSGSDALAAKANAVRSGDGMHWILNGEKMWITNAAFADVFITFAQVDGKQFSCFIVEKDYPGVSTGAEEQKMGLKGSSTRTLVLDNAKVPIDNVVGEIGKGHHVAFNILNIGRAKLGAGALGGSKTALNDAIQYAKQRIAFGKPIASFGAIKHKLAEMAVRTWILEGLVYRTAGLMDRSLDSVDVDNMPQVLKAIEEYAIECSILKVFGSEVLDFVVDEAVQIYGGYGYSAEYSVERYYRDSRVNRIFEGTNEINRLLIPGMLLKRATTGRLPLHAAARAVVDEVMSASLPSEPSGPFGPELAATAQAKKALLFVAGSAIQKYMDAIRDEQEVLMHISNMVMEVFAMDTALHRLLKKGSTEIHQDAARTFINDAMSRVEFSARQVLAAVAEGDMLRTQLSAIRRLLRWTPINTVRTRQQIADYLIEQGRYAL
ncbi:MAG: acyl-CoA dehydrogenase family protein [Acidobacteria bacterium]|nr:acyl-CoA dehydrogenase family protein [Acidobacteriota bacterium]